MSFSIAIDGPSGAGKSTIAKELAKRLDLIFINSGAMYRAVGLYVYENNISFDESAVSACLDYINIHIDLDNDNIFLNNKNITNIIGTNEIGEYGSKCGEYPAVRHKLVKIQQEIAKDKRVIMEGRDIASVVLPKADIKIYLDASVEERAKRRSIKEGTLYENALKETLIRDERDINRKHDPLTKVSDAIVIDSSNMTTCEVVEEIINIAGEVNVL